MSDAAVAGAFLLLLIGFALWIALYALPPAWARTYAVAGPASEQAVKWAWVVKRPDGTVALMLYPTPDLRTAQSVSGGVVLARVAMWPGGYNCTMYAPGVYKFGPDPYTGIWCPPPWKTADQVPKNCRPWNAVSRGRVVLIEFRCT